MNRAGKIAQGSGLRAQGSGLRAQGSGLRAQGVLSPVANLNANPTAPGGLALRRQGGRAPFVLRCGAFPLTKINDPP